MTKLMWKILVTGLLLDSVLNAMTATAEELKDPTRPPFYRSDTATIELGQGSILSPDSTDTWILNSTLISGTQRLAVINGKLLSEGDKIGNMVVVDIKQSKVLLRVNNETVEVTLVHSNVKTSMNDPKQKIQGQN